ncbi:MAG: preprotein translocase subunit SecE [Lachnospiraceae bacterium]|nr:preprotein translocase subunit SecE [Ruminococcus sp.]MCM1275318.1 preprotein translocase subunit SecE [Lachnospiraceae bacterium]
MAKDLELEKNSPENSSDKAKKSKDDKSAKDKKKSGKKKKGIVKYFKDARSEFKKVVWPTPKETTHNTVVVLIMCGLAALLIFGIDSLFGLLNGLLFH